MLIKMVHEQLPLRFWEELHQIYKKYRKGTISLEDCYAKQLELYQFQIEQPSKEEEQGKSWEKYKKLDSLFEKIKNKTEEQRVLSENDQISKANENKPAPRYRGLYPDRKEMKPSKDASKSVKKLISPTDFQDDEPDVLGNMIGQMMKSWNFLENDCYTCEMCGEKFTLAAYFQRHIKDHKDYKPFACNICGYSAKSKSLATDHLRLKHNPSLSNLTSQKVDDLKSQDAIITKKLEQLWMFTKEGSKGLYDCDVCKQENTNFTSIQPQIFEHHIATSHPGYKPFTCNVCPYTANRRNNLTTHVKKFHYNMLSNLA